MVKPLQQFDFRSSPYERPDKDWVCGHAADGKACQIGPDKKGNCRAIAECKPGKDGDRWQCSRSALQGGPCPDGPNPDGSCCKPIIRCQPQRSWRAKRGAVVKWAIGLTLGLLLITFAVPGKLGLLSPGELSSSHSALAECSSCHASADGTFTQWVSSVFGEYDHAADSQQCQTCHDLGNDALAAHSLAPTELTRLGSAETPTSLASPVYSLASKWFDPQKINGEGMTCNSCHSEHEGLSGDLNTSNDSTCVICHQTQFESFTNGHPEFVGYPNDRRTNLIFDHVSHIEKHFAEEKNTAIAPDSCGSCHVTQVGGGKMVVKGFDDTCAACHDSQIRGTERASAKGIAVMGVPGLDIATLAENNVAIGEWPEYAEDGLSPIMRLLLNRVDGFAEVESVVDSLDLLDMTDASPEQLQAAGELAWMVKDLFYELESRGTDAFVERVRAVTGSETNSLVLERSLASMPPDMFESARLNWFPSLLEEVQKHRAGLEVLSPLAIVEEDAVVDESTSEDDASDEFDSLFGEESDDQNAGVDDSEFDALFGDDETNDGALSESEESEFDALFADDGEEVESNLDAQGEAEFDSLFGDGDSSTDSDEIDITALDDEGDEFSIEDLEESVIDEDDSNETDITEPAFQFEDPRIAVEDRAGAGGWYRDEFNLRYRPSGHADGFISAWSELGTSKFSSVLERIFVDVTDDSSPGSCVKCHSVDKVGGNTVVNWKARQSDPSIHGFNKFSHQAHFNLMSDTGCLGCHSFDKESDYAGSFADFDPDTFASNFNTISEQTCQECHQEDKAGENCLTCHNYHIGEFAPVLSESGGLRTSSAASQ